MLHLEFFLFHVRIVAYIIPLLNRYNTSKSLRYWFIWDSVTILTEGVVYMISGTEHLIYFIKDFHTAYVFTFVESGYSKEMVYKANITVVAVSTFSFFFLYLFNGLEYVLFCNLHILVALSILLYILSYGTV